MNNRTIVVRVRPGQRVLVIAERERRHHRRHHRQCNRGCWFF